MLSKSFWITILKKIKNKFNIFDTNCCEHFCQICLQAVRSTAEKAVLSWHKKKASFNAKCHIIVFMHVFLYND